MSDGRILATHVGMAPVSASDALAALDGIHERPPERVYVTAELVHAVQQRFGPSVDVVVESPEFVAELMEDLLDELASLATSEEPPSYLEHGHIAEPLLRALFEAAAALYRLQPWRTVADDHPIAIDVPAIGLHDACLVVIGGLDENRGLLLFDSVASYDAFGDGPAEGQAVPYLGGYLLSLNYEDGDALAASLRGEVEEHRWTVAASDGYPVVLCLDPDGIRRPTREADVVLATVCAAAVTELLTRRGAALAEQHPGTIVEELGTPTTGPVRLRVPHPDSRPLDPDNPCACGSGRTFGGCHLRDDPESPSRARRRADYDGWPDRRIPALQRQTPREAMRSPEGRAKVQQLVELLAAMEMDSPEGHRIDLTPLRVALGLP